MTLPIDVRLPSHGEYRLATIASPDGARPVVVTDHGQWSIEEVTPHLMGDSARAGLLPALDRREIARRDLAAIVDGQARRTPEMFDPASLLAPILFCRKVIGIGDNYADHNESLGKPRMDRSTTRPGLFLKPPTTSVVNLGSTSRLH